MGTDSNVYIKIIGKTRRRHTGKLFLELLQKRAFLPGSVETFSLEAVDVEDVKQIEVNSNFTAPDVPVYTSYIHSHINRSFIVFSPVFIQKRGTHSEFKLEEVAK